MALLAHRAPCSRGLATPMQRPRVVAVRNAVSAPPQASVDVQAKVVALSSSEYEDFIAQNEMVLVDYYTEWCGPCKMIAPHLEEMAAEMPGVKFAKLNCTTDAAAKKIAMAQGIKALPTFHFFRKNERVGVFVGGKPHQLKKFIVEQMG